MINSTAAADADLAERIAVREAKRRVRDIAWRKVPSVRISCRLGDLDDRDDLDDLDVPDALLDSRGTIATTTITASSLLVKFVHDDTHGYALILTDMIRVWYRQSTSVMIDEEHRKYAPSVRKKSTLHLMQLMETLLFGTSPSHTHEIAPSTTSIELRASMPLPPITFSWAWPCKPLGSRAHQAHFLKQQLISPLHEMARIAIVRCSTLLSSSSSSSGSMSARMPQYPSGTLPSFSSLSQSQQNSASGSSASSSSWRQTCTDASYPTQSQSAANQVEFGELYQAAVAHLLATSQSSSIDDGNASNGSSASSSALASSSATAPSTAAGRKARPGKRGASAASTVDDATSSDSANHPVEHAADNDHDHLRHHDDGSHGAAAFATASSSSNGAPPVDTEAERQRRAELQQRLDLEQQQKKRRRRAFV